MTRHKEVGLREVWGCTVRCSPKDSRAIQGGERQTGTWSGVANNGRLRVMALIQGIRERVAWARTIRKVTQRAGATAEP